MLSTFLPLVPLAFLCHHVAFSVVSAAPVAPVVNSDRPNTAGSLTLQIYSNTALAGRPLLSTQLSYPSFTISTTAVTGPCSAYLSGTLVFPTAGIYNFTCTFTSTTTGWAWIDGHQICNDGNTYHLEPGRYDNPLWIRRDRLVGDASSNGGAVPVRPMPLRVKVMYNGDCEQHPPKFDIQWRRIDANTSNKSSTGSVTTLIPHLPPAEQRRDALQNSLARGWGTWLHPNLLSIVKLPEAIVVTPRICKVSTGACITAAIPDGRYRKYDVSTRVDLHAWDRSYAQYFVGPGGTEDDVTTHVNANISVEMGAYGKNNQELSLMLTPVSCDGGVDCSDYQVRLEGRYAWFRAGVADAALNGKSIAFASAGLGTVNILSTTNSTTARSDGKNVILLPFVSAGDGVGVATVVDMTIDQIRIHLDNAKAKELERLYDTFGISAAEVAKAIQAAVMWTNIYNPVENGPFMPVSRGWGKNLNNAKSDDWIYVIFEWDTFFASMLAGLVNKDISYSNLFQVVKSKTSAGFMPNYFFGGVSSEDRTEPPVGAKVVLELYNKFKDKWMVEVVFDDLLDWHEWFLRRRILWPAGLVALGSWNEQRPYTGQGDDGNSMYAARLESGLDNSPMYDGNFFDNTTSHLMQMYDVGMSSLFVQEAYALANLADAIGRPEGRVLRSRGNMMADKIRRQLWDESTGVYVNKFVNGTFYRRISPTSFYAMMAHAPSDSQAAKMVNDWLFNSSRFCISPRGDFKGNQDDCYWGLPSISADDPAFLREGVWNYWRGFSWGPMAMLTYWSLQNYGHVPEVCQGRIALCKQMKALMTSQWDQHRHVCENYNPHKTADPSNGDCSGTPFYHWGALTGLIGFMEHGPRPSWNELGDKTNITYSRHVNSGFSIL